MRENVSAIRVISMLTEDEANCLCWQFFVYKILILASSPSDQTESTGVLALSSRATKLHPL
jgi:hypothetical protein